MARGLTFDTGALIALESRRKRIKEILAAARTLGVVITVPTVVVAEWWRAQKGAVARILDGVVVEPLSEHLARVAGEALAKTRRSNAIDAIVVASAAQRGDIVYTSDLADLQAIAAYFPGVRVLRV
jgi:predicted nucleic acid-binding protein